MEKFKYPMHSSTDSLKLVHRCKIHFCKLFSLLKTNRNCSFSARSQTLENHHLSNYSIQVLRRTLSIKHIQGIPAFCDFTIWDPRYWLWFNFGPHFIDLKEKVYEKIIRYFLLGNFLWIFKKNLIYSFLFCIQWLSSDEY